MAGGAAASTRGDGGDERERRGIDGGDEIVYADAASDAGGWRVCKTFYPVRLLQLISALTPPRRLRSWRWNGNWEELALEQDDIIFCIMVGNVVLKKMCVGQIPSNRVKPLEHFQQRYWIRPRLNFAGGFPFKGGDLVEIDFASGKGASASRVLKGNLSASDPLVRTLELTAMWGDEDLRERLIHFFDSGEDVNQFKKKVFPDV